MAAFKRTEIDVFIGSLIRHIFFLEAVAYEWGHKAGMIKFSYPSDKRPDTSEDLLSLGFISPSFDAVLVRIDSDPKHNNDYLQLEIVSIIYLFLIKVSKQSNNSPPFAWRG